MITFKNVKIGDLLIVTSEGLDKHDFKEGDIVEVLKYDTSDGSVRTCLVEERGDVQWLWPVNAEMYKPVSTKDEYIIFPTTKNPSTYAKYCYAISKQLGEDGGRIKESDYHLLDTSENNKRVCEAKDREGILKLYGSEKSDNNQLIQLKVIFDALVNGYIPTIAGDANRVVNLITDSHPTLNQTTLNHDLSLVTPFVRLIGHNVSFDYDTKGMATGTGDNRKPLTIKAFGRKFGFNKWECWPVIAEKLKEEVDKDIKIEYFTSYSDLKKYYTMPSCSDESCMRHPFEELPLHPCAVYAHDIEEYAEGSLDIYNYVSTGIKLAVLFEGKGAIARCMVNIDSKSRGSAFGSGASVLTKMLGYENDGIDGCINIIKCDKGVIMPYIDGSDEVDEDNGEIGVGSLGCDETGGLSVSGHYSEWHDCIIPEDEAVYSDVLSDWIREDCSVALHEGGVTHENDDDLHYSVYSDCHFIDTDEWCCFNDDWIPEDSIEEVCIDIIRCDASISELIEFAEGL